MIVFQDHIFKKHGLIHSFVVSLDRATKKETTLGKLQGLSVPFACIGSGDPVRVLHLYTMNTLDVL